MLDIVEIDETVAQTFFEMRAGVCGARLQPTGKMEIRIRRKGQTEYFATYPVWQRDELGRLSFYWDSVFLAAAAGYYEGDVYTGSTEACSKCATIQFRKRACTFAMVNAQHIITEDFTPPCDDRGFVTETIAGDSCDVERVEDDCGATPYGINQPPLPVVECTPCGGAGYASGEVASLPAAAILDTIGEEGNGEGCGDVC